MEEDELHEIEEHHLPTTPTLTTTTSDDKENDAQVLKHFQFIFLFCKICCCNVSWFGSREYLLGMGNYFFDSEFRSCQ